MDSHSIIDLLKKEAKLRVDLTDPKVTEIEMPRGFFHQQIGLRDVMCGADGRLWDVGSNPIKVIFDPRWVASKGIVT